MKWKTPEQRREYYRKWRKSHREERKQYQRDYYKRHHDECRAYDKNYQKENPEINRASWMVYEAIKSGRLVKKPCVICGKKAEAHHPDYNKPLEIVWLCKSHHKIFHLGELVLNVCAEKIKASKKKKKKAKK